MASIDDIWLVDFGEPYPGEPAAHRPALILGPPDAFGPSFPFVIVAPMTRTKHGVSLHIELEPSLENGLDETSYVQCELLRSINHKRLRHQLGTIDAATSIRIAGVVRTLLNY